MPFDDIRRHLRSLVEKTRFIYETEGATAPLEIELRVGKMTPREFDPTVLPAAFFDCIERARALHGAKSSPWRPIDDFYYEHLTVVDTAAANNSIDTVRGLYTDSTPRATNTTGKKTRCRTRVAYCSCGMLETEHIVKTRLSHFDEALVGGLIGKMTDVPAVRGSLSREDPIKPPAIILPHRVAMAHRSSVFFPSSCVPFHGTNTVTVETRCEKNRWRL